MAAPDGGTGIAPLRPEALEQLMANAAHPAASEPASPSADTRPPLRVALYSHDTLGLGHIRRNLLLAQAIANAPLGATILMLAGAREAALFPMPPRVDCTTLPSIQKGNDGQYRSRRLCLSLRQIVSLRAHIIQGALEAFRPDMLVVDTEPRGAFRELEPALSWLRMQGRTHCVLGLRDIRDDATAVRREWRTTSSDTAIRDYYDEVWVYGDPRVFDVVREYRFPHDVATKLRYTGYLDQRARLDFVQPGDDGPRLLATLPTGRMVLCTVGGGQDGIALARAFIATPLLHDTFGLVLAGPQMPPDMLEHLRQRTEPSRCVRVLRFVPEPAPLFARADRLITMGGYNSALEAVSFAKPALIVPRVKPRQEQWLRADRLRALGLVDVLHPDELSPGRLGAWLAQEREHPQASGTVDLGGLPRIVEFLKERQWRVARPEAS
jgi:predicted glycosyltransferase